MPCGFILGSAEVFGCQMMTKCLTLTFEMYNIYLLSSKVRLDLSCFALKSHLCGKKFSTIGRTRPLLKKKTNKPKPCPILRAKGRKARVELFDYMPILSLKERQHWSPVMHERKGCSTTAQEGKTAFVLSVGLLIHLWKPAYEKSDISAARSDRSKGHQSSGGPAFLC